MILRRVTVLGSTGSVGCSTLDLMDQAERAGTGAFMRVASLWGGSLHPTAGRITNVRGGRRAV